MGLFGNKPPEQPPAPQPAAAATTTAPKPAVDSSRLTKEDVEKLLRDPSVDTRVEVLDKLSGTYNNSQALVGDQRRVAESIFRVLKDDKELEVRKSLAKNLLLNENVPKDIIMGLANDVDEVSTPVLRDSPVLDDDDLVKIISNKPNSTASHLAISNRKNVGAKVSDALVSTNNEAVVTNLLNRGDVAQISDITYQKILKGFETNESVLTAMSKRESLSAAIVRGLAKVAPGIIKEGLVLKYTEKKKEGQPDANSKLVGRSIEDELMDVVNQLEEAGVLAHELHRGRGPMVKMIESLEHLGRFSPITVLGLGHLLLFEISLSRMTKLPITNVQKLVRDVSGIGLKAIYEKAGLPSSMFPAVQLVSHVLQELDSEYKKKNNNNKIITPDYEYVRHKIDTYGNGLYIESIGYFTALLEKNLKRKKM